MLVAYEVVVWFILVCSVQKKYVVWFGLANPRLCGPLKPSVTSTYNIGHDKTVSSGSLCVKSIRQGVAQVKSITFAVPVPIPISCFPYLFPFETLNKQNEVFFKHLTCGEPPREKWTMANYLFYIASQ
jgi:hypothetical protein